MATIRLTEFSPLPVKSYTSAAIAYSKAAFCAATDARDIPSKEGKVTVGDAKMDSTGRGHAGKATRTEAETIHTALLNKASAAGAKAKAALAKAKIAEEAFATAAAQGSVNSRG